MVPIFFIWTQGQVKKDQNGQILKFKFLSKTRVYKNQFCFRIDHNGVINFCVRHLEIQKQKLMRKMTLCFPPDFEQKSGGKIEYRHQIWSVKNWDIASKFGMENAQEYVPNISSSFYIIQICTF